MYFITEQDPNYTVKGSRDPLGFQVIWQEAARKLIPNLSTVSSNIKDYQILSLAHALKHQLSIADADFEPFFFRFEQLMAYTRYKQAPGEGFNGVDKVRKIMSADPTTVRISNNSADQLLSNQRSYGIWGKYIRPFTDMGLTEIPVFEKVYSEKISANPEFLHQVTSIKKKTDGAAQVSIGKLEAFFQLLEKPKKEERQIFVDRLLEDKCENELIGLLSKTKVEKLSFYQLINMLSAASKKQTFKTILNYILNTEKVLSPLDHIFRYLQTRSFWEINEIVIDPFVKNWRTKVDVGGFSEVSLSLAVLLQKSNVELVEGLVARNEEVCNRRHSAPWMTLTPAGLEINHFEGSYFSESYNPAEHNNNNYFLTSFFSLYNQLN